MKEEPIETKLKIAEQKADDVHNRFMKISSEFEGYKRRSAIEIMNFKKFANASLIKEILPIADNLERALDSSRNNTQIDADLINGINMILKDLLNQHLKIFKKFNVKQIDSIGKIFDPTIHYAVVQEKTDSCPSNTVTKQMQKGYMLHDRLIRPAMVAVSTL